MITRYYKYIDVLDKKLTEMFEKQEAFIKCKKGCSICCKEGAFTLSELEYIGMMLYYNEIDDKLKEKVDFNINNLLKSTKTKIYECPFLVDNICCVYKARSIMCRTFGLISYYKNEQFKIPFCVDIGLNFAEAYDGNLRKTVKTSIHEKIPQAFNIDRRTLRSKKVEQEFNILFGEDKPMIDWLREDFDI